MRSASELGLGLAALALGGCTLLAANLDRGHADPRDAGAPDAGRDGGPDAFMLPTGTCEEPSGVDLLFVIDNSNSMLEEQESLAAQLPFFLRALVDPPDLDMDGEPDWLPVPDLQIGVVTTDMGTGGFTVPTCTRADFGDDGALRTIGRADLEGCASSYPSFLQFRAGAGSPEALAFDLGCVTRVGIGGCGFEQPLEAALKALSPARPTAYTGPGYVSPTFFRGTLGNGDGPNAGFVRDDTLLAIVVVTDEEDCSAFVPELFDPSSSSRFTGTDLNLRCFVYAEEAVHPVSRFVEGLSALRARRPDLLAFAVLAGIPADLAVSSPTSEDLQRMLDDPRMEERVEPDMSRLVPSCNVPGRGVAFPPRRLVQVARALAPGRSTVQSICQEDYTLATTAIARLVGSRACTRFEP